MSGITKWRYNFPGFVVKPYDFKDKDKAIDNYVRYMLDRTQSMFEYDGLPDSIPQRSLELFIQSIGHVGICRVNGELYALYGGLGGEPDPYYMPTVYTVSNPALKYSANLKIGEDVIVIPNDSLYMGLLPLMARYATAMAENDVTFRVMDINARITSLVSSSDDKALKGAQKYLADVEKGELGVVAEAAFLEGLKAQPYASTGVTRFTDLIEYQQYLRGSWLNELGIDAAYNMKREALNSAESALGQDALYPLIHDMLHQREIALEKVNALFGTNISVKLASIWAGNEAELEAEIELAENVEDEPAPSVAEVTDEEEAEDSTEESDKNTEDGNEEKEDEDDESDKT